MKLLHEPWQKRIEKMVDLLWKCLFHLFLSYECHDKDVIPLGDSETGSRWFCNEEQTAEVGWLQRCCDQMGHDPREATTGTTGAENPLQFVPSEEIRLLTILQTRQRKSWKPSWGISMFKPCFGSHVCGKIFQILPSCAIGNMFEEKTSFILLKKKENIFKENCFVLFSSAKRGRARPPRLAGSPWLAAPLRSGANSNRSRAVRSETENEKTKTKKTKKQRIFLKKGEKIRNRWMSGAKLWVQTLGQNMHWLRFLSSARLLFFKVFPA